MHYNHDSRKELAQMKISAFVEYYHDILDVFKEKKEEQENQLKKTNKKR